MFKSKSTLWALAGSLLLLGCASLISEFDQKALDQAETLKATSLALMNKATNSHSDHKSEIDALKVAVEEAYAYAKQREQNLLTVKQWEVLKDAESNLLGGFLKLWESEGKLDAVFVEEATKLVAAGFDNIIELEKAKKGITNNPLNGE